MHVDEYKDLVCRIVLSRQPVSDREVWQLLESIAGAAFHPDNAQDAIDTLFDDRALEEDRSGNWWLFGS